MVKGTNTMVSNALIIGNEATSATAAGGIFAEDDKMKLISIIITNNMSGATFNTVIILNLNGSKNELIITNNWIGGNDESTSYGIYEFDDLSGHTLKNNTFISERLTYWYKNHTSALNFRNIDKLNDGSTGAGSATGAETNSSTGIGIDGEKEGMWAAASYYNGSSGSFKTLDAHDILAWDTIANVYITNDSTNIYILD